MGENHTWGGEGPPLPHDEDPNPTDDVDPSADDVDVDRPTDDADVGDLAPADTADPDLERMLAESLGETGLIPPAPPGFRSGFVGIVGRPNVGKSTLLNALLGEKVSIVSPRPQTTRHNVRGILTREDAQIVFVDTPGYHLPKNKLGEYMVENVHRFLPDADVLVFLVDGSERPNAKDRALARAVSEQSRARVLLAVNKVDLCPDRHAALSRYRELLPPETPYLFLSALTGEGLPELLDQIVALLPEGPYLYPPGVITDLPLREQIAEAIREKALLHLHEEVPHSVAVSVEEMQDRPNGKTYIRALLYVERESQKGIVIGQGGAMLRRIGTEARQEIEQILERPVFLELRVKVLPRWRKKESALRWLGYKLPGRRKGRKRKKRR